MDAVSKVKTKASADTDTAVDTVSRAKTKPRADSATAADTVATVTTYARTRGDTATPAESIFPYTPPHTATIITGATIHRVEFAGQSLKPEIVGQVILGHTIVGQVILGPTIVGQVILVHTIIGQVER